MALKFTPRSHTSFLKLDIEVGGGASAVLGQNIKQVRELQTAIGVLENRLIGVREKIAAIQRSQKVQLAQARREHNERMVALEKEKVGMRPEHYAKQKAAAVERYKAEVLAIKERNAALITAEKDRQRLAQAAKTQTRLQIAEVKRLQAAEATAAMARRKAFAEQIRIQRAVRATIARTTRAIERQNVALMRTGKHLGWMVAQLHKFAIVFGRVARALLSFAVIAVVFQTVRFFFSYLIESNKIIDTLNARLKSMIKNTEDLAKVNQKLRIITLYTPYTFQQLVDAAALLRAYTSDVTGNMSAIADWAAVTSREIGDTAIAFGKIVAYSPRTALLLSTRGINPRLFELYAEKFADRAIALNRLINDLYGGTARNVAQSFEGILSNLNDIWIFVSQKLGKTLFEDIKIALKTLFRMLVEMEKALGGAQKIWEAIKFTIMAIAPGLSQIVDHMYSASIRASSWKETLSLIGELARTDIDDLSVRLSLAEQITETSKETVKSYANMIDVIGVILGLDDGRLQAAWDLWVIHRKLTLELEKQVELRQRELLAQAGFGKIEAFELAQVVEEAGVTPALQSILDQVNALVEETDKKLVDGVKETFTKIKGMPLTIPFTEKERDEMEQTLAYFKGWQTSLVGILEKPDLAKILAVIEADMKKLVLEPGELTKEGLMQRQIILKMTLEWIAKMKKKLEGGKDEDDLAKVIFGDIDDWTAYHEKVNNLAHAVIGLYRNIQEFYTASVGGEAAVRKLNEQMVGVYKKEELRLQRQYISQLEKQFAIPINDIPQQIKWTINLLDIEKDIIQNKEKQLELLKKLTEHSYTFGQALGKELIKIENELDNVNARLAQMTVDLFTDIGVGVMDEILWGDRRENLTDQIATLESQLANIRAEKQNIQIIEDREVEILARINELEAERANFLVRTTKDILKKFTQELEELAVKRVLAAIMAPLTEAPPGIEAIRELGDELVRGYPAALGYEVALQAQALVRLGIYQQMANINMGLGVFGAFGGAFQSPTGSEGGFENNPKLPPPPVEMPTLPVIEIPAIAFEMPAVPKFDVPALEIPPIKYEAPEIPPIRQEMPEIPELEIPPIPPLKISSIEIPAFPEIPPITLEMPSIPRLPSLEVPTISPVAWERPPIPLKIPLTAFEMPATLVEPPSLSKGKMSDINRYRDKSYSTGGEELTVNIIGDVYGMRDFEKQVDKAIQQIRRNTS